ncbi:methyltransferase family protein [Jiulongibacter sp. NS-SX5]|uniref:methyltransferase family protein n=1 Tax=Jiulongibacter sp. NS-SX5 TaxID=3463854 RepID=UPI00405829A4
MALKEEFESQGNFLFRYRSYFPIIFLLVALAVFVNEVLKENQTLFSQNYWFFSLGVGLFGLLIRVFTVGFTPKNTSGRNTAEGQVADELNETGIYSIVRHPLYVGNYFMWLGVAMLTANLWFIVAFTLTYWVYYERIMYAEEAFLRGKFGEKYTDWALGRPAFVPKLTGLKKPKYPFSLKKVLKKEKNGIAALFGLFWLFDMVKVYTFTCEIALQKNFWFYAFIGGMVFYLIFKVLKRTSLLEDGR